MTVPSHSTSVRQLKFPQHQTVVGIARAEVTPPVGMYHRMWGAAKVDRSTGIHRPLTATVLYFEPHPGSAPGESPRVLVSLDHCLLWQREMHMLLDGMVRATGLDASAISVWFTHTHAAGLLGLERSNLPGGEGIADYLACLSRQLGQLAVTARERRTPATMVYGTGRCSLAMHRDYLDETYGKYVCGANPTGPADDSVLVARIASTAGQVLGTIVNYACHPTTLAWDNTLISPDYVGAMCEVVEGATGAPCFFAQGASGDIGPRDGFVGDPAVADRNGRQLGYAALSALESLPPAGQRFVYQGPVVSGATLGTWAYEPVTADDAAQSRVWRSQWLTLPIPYRADLPTMAQMEADKLHWQAALEAAERQGETSGQASARAMLERADRSFTRFGGLPEGDHYPLCIPLWRMGDAIWIPLNGEHYNVLQRELRARFPQQALVFGTLANGSQVWYVPDAASFGKGLYQEDASILAKGCLEIILQGLTTGIHALLEPK